MEALHCAGKHGHAGELERLLADGVEIEAKTPQVTLCCCLLLCRPFSMLLLLTLTTCCPSAASSSCVNLNNV